MAEKQTIRELIAKKVKAEFQEEVEATVCSACNCSPHTPVTDGNRKRFEEVIASATE